MPTTKKVNYTPAQEKEMDETYPTSKDSTDEDRADAIKALASKFGKTEPSIRSKLSNMGIYIVPKTVSKVSGAVVVRKPELVAQLAEKLGLEGEDIKKVDSGIKATKGFLELVLAQMSHLEVRIAEFEAPAQPETETA